MNNRSLVGKTVLAALVIVLILFGDYLQSLALVIDPEGIKTLLGKAGSLAPLVLMLCMALAVVIPFIPSLALDIAAGAFFGPVSGTVYCAAGALGGAVAAFGLSRYYGREVIARFLSGHINFCPQCSDRLLTKVVFTSRLLPVVSFRLVSYGAGLTKMSVKAFSLATLIGMLPVTFACNYFGAAIWEASPGTAMVLGALMVSAFFLLPLLIERYDLLALRQYFQHEEEG